MMLLADDSMAAFSILCCSAGIIILLAAAAVAVYFVRKRLSPNEDFHGEGFTLSDLRQLHKSGQMSDEEFERAKAQLLKGLAVKKEQQKQSDPGPGSAPS